MSNEIKTTIKEELNVNSANYLREFGFESILKAPIQTKLDSGLMRDSSNIKIFAVNIGNADEKFFTLSNELSSAHLLVAFARTRNREWKIQLFSKHKDIDCQKVANSFGGIGTKEYGEFFSKVLPFEY